MEWPVEHNRLQDDDDDDDDDGGDDDDDDYDDYEEPTSEFQLWQASTQWDNPQSRQHF